jgi:hypothetical protein
MNPVVQPEGSLQTRVRFRRNSPLVMVRNVDRNKKSHPKVAFSLEAIQNSGGVDGTRTRAPRRSLKPSSPLRKVTRCGSQLRDPNDTHRHPIPYTATASLGRAATLGVTHATRSLLSAAEIQSLWACPGARSRWRSNSRPFTIAVR